MYLKSIAVLALLYGVNAEDVKPQCDGHDAGELEILNPDGSGTCIQCPNLERAQLKNTKCEADPCDKDKQIVNPDGTCFDCKADETVANNKCVPPQVAQPNAPSIIKADGHCTNHGQQIGDMYQKPEQCAVLIKGEPVCKNAGGIFVLDKKYGICKCCLNSNDATTKFTVSAGWDMYSSGEANCDFTKQYITPQNTCEPCPAGSKPNPTNHKECEKHLKPVDPNAQVVVYTECKDENGRKPGVREFYEADGKCKQCPKYTKAVEKNTKCEPDSCDYAKQILKENGTCETCTNGKVVSKNDKQCVEPTHADAKQPINNGGNNNGNGAVNSTYNLGSSVAVYAFFLIIADILILVLFLYVAVRLISTNKTTNMILNAFVILLCIKQIFNLVFKLYLCFELVARSLDPSNVKPDRVFYGLYGTSVVLLMVCVAINMNIMFSYYCRVKEVSEYVDQNEGNYRTPKLLLLWFTFMVLMFMVAAGTSVIRASAVTEDVTANLLGKFYGISGFTFLTLSIAFGLVIGMTLFTIRSEYKFHYDPHACKMITATFFLIVPIFTRGIFDLIIGLNKTAREQVGITDLPIGGEIILFLTTGIFFDTIPLIAQLAVLVLMDKFEKIVQQMSYEKGSWQQLRDIETKQGELNDDDSRKYNSQEEIDLQMRNMDFINDQIQRKKTMSNQGSFIKQSTDVGVRQSSERVVYHEAQPVQTQRVVYADGGLRQSTQRVVYHEAQPVQTERVVYTDAQPVQTERVVYADGGLRQSTQRVVYQDGQHNGTQRVVYREGENQLRQSNRVVYQDSTNSIKSPLLQSPQPKY